MRFDFRALRGVLFALAGVALLVQAMLPAGFMPKIGDGTFQIVICRGADLVTITVDQNMVPVAEYTAGKLSNAAHDQVGAVKCPFFMNGHMLSLNGVCPFMLADYLGTVIRLSLGTQSKVEGIAAKTLYSQGPPAI